MSRYRLTRAVTGASVLVLTAAAAVSAATGEVRLAAAALALLLGMVAAGTLYAVSLLRAIDNRIRKIKDRQLESRRHADQDRARRRAEDVESARLHRTILADLPERLSAMEVRSSESFEAERLRAADRHRELGDGLTTLGSTLSEVESSLTDLRAQWRETRKIPELTPKKLEREVERVLKEVRGSTGEVEAILQILPRLSPPALLPPTGRWAINARSLAHLVDLVDRENPEMILELGSGTSTIWLGHLLKDTGTRFVSVDHSDVFIERTRRQLELHGLLGAVDLRLAPLEEVTVGDRRVTWYSPESLSDLNDIDLLLVDGPPGSSTTRARWPAFPFLRDRLSPRALVVLDDADRPDEIASIELWQASEPALSREDEGVSRLAVLRRAP